MRLDIKVIPRSSQLKIVDDEKPWKVYVRASATDGKANQAVICLLSEYFNVPKSHVRIMRGTAARLKVIEIST